MRENAFHPSMSDIVEEPIRGQIFSIERLEEYAVYLAENLLTEKAPKLSRPLLRRMRDSSEKLLASYRALISAIRNKEAISPAAEWLIDNFHIIEEQVREIKNDLPKSYYEELPKLSMGDLAGYPRIYALALAMVAHTDSRLDVTTIRRFIQAFQTKSYLCIGELWAVAITLRLALVENARRVALRVVWDMNQRQEADALADELLESVSDPERFKKIVDSIPRRCGKSVETEYALIAQLAKRLRDQEADIWPATECIERTLASCHCTMEQIVSLDHQHQAANQVTIENIISSMRLLSNINWQAFFETVCLLDRDLEKDPSEHYQRMDFTTRDDYRHVIERIGKRTKVSEQAITQKVLQLSRDSGKHVGFFLNEPRVEELEHLFHYNPSLSERLLRLVLSYPTVFYLGSLIFVTALAEVLPLIYAGHHQASWRMLVLLAILLFIPCSDLAVSCVNYALTNLIKPRRLPKMDLSLGVPSEARTLVIIPCLLCDIKTIQDLLEKLEVHYLGNTDKEVFFALATDFMDAATEHTPEDESLVKYAEAGIKNLNETYKESARFFLFHRRRLWNPRENKWMGWERKRGKIEELNHLLRGDSKTSYEVVTCPSTLLSSFRYVITLDADTQLGRDTAKKLIGTALHPLNRPHFDRELGRVVSGYGIIQPRVSISLESSSSSLFAMIFSGNTGIDPYTTAVSDVYQDLFCEGSFTGKGLYDIDAFQAALQDRVPENTVLSHDLLEGLYARAALVTDIELLDDYPKSYLSFFQRQHRWVRGDWQIARWLLPFVFRASGALEANKLSLISRWKIYDNLRRSLVAPGIFLLFVMGWFVLPGSFLFWTGFALFVVALPCFLHVANGILISPRGIPWTSNFWSEVSKTRMNFGQFFMSLTFLLHQAYIQMDAILRAGFRVLISKRRCLEWVTSAQVDKESAHLRRAVWQSAWPVEIIVMMLGAAALFIAIMKGTFLQLLVIGPFLTLWAGYPLVAKITSRRLHPHKPELAASERKLLQEHGRRIWHFFETFVGEEDNWLPPDNIQEDPERLVAHRTSPTNIGLYALAVLSARDCGFLNLSACFRRLGLLNGALKRLERFEGHFLNWYDTQTLEPLEPRYVSSVDSGNLAGYLIVVRQACAELKNSPLFHKNYLEGLQVTLAIIEQEVQQLQEQRQATSAISASYLLNQIHESQAALQGAAPESLSNWASLVRFLNHSMDDMRDSIDALELEHGPRYYRRLKDWVEANLHLVRDLQNDLELYAPWLETSYWREGTELHEEQQLLQSLDAHYVLTEMPEVFDAALEQIAILIRNEKTKASSEDFLEVKESLERGRKNVLSLLESVDEIQRDFDLLFKEINFDYLIDKNRGVFSIGYNIKEGRHDNAYYDLLASEARLASFVAIAKGDTPQKHWFRLGRQLVPAEGGRALISWSASMFEYLMPQLVMRNYEGTLLHETMDAVVKKQISYGKKMRVPWGISEAGYNARDINFNYQYGPFGIPGLGLKRGLGHDLVVSPYSTFLAALIDPVVAVKNLRTLMKQNLLTCYGFYESIDYTPERVSAEQKFAVIKSFMAHHQGMSFVAINNILHSDIMQKRFHSDLRVRATQLLLQERVPQKVALSTPKAAEIEWEGAGESLLKSFTRVYENPNLSTPRVQLLSNGTYSLMLSTAGAGYSRCEGLAVTRWKEDATRDHWGSFIYIRDMDRDQVWSSSYQPVIRKPESYKVIFAEDKVDFWRQDGDIRSHTQIIVAPEDNVEIRYVSLTNDSLEERHIEVTSYLEPVLAPAAEDLAHPAFSNLFLQTEFLASRHVLIARRRPRSAQKQEVWGLHGVVSDSEYLGGVEYETDRSRFVGRGRHLANALAITESGPLSNTVGSTLDPVLSLRVRLKLPPGATQRVAFTTGLTHSRPEVLQMADRYHDIHAFERESKLAWTKARIDMRHLGMDSEAAYLSQRLAERVLYVDPTLRPPSHFLAAHVREQASLWPYGIGGDLPIVAATVSDKRDLGMIRRLLRGHEYLRLKGLSYDFVILNDSKTTYLQELQDDIQRQVRYSGTQGWLNKPGGIFILRLDSMPESDRALIQAMARVSLSSEMGSLKEQLGRRTVAEKSPGSLRPIAERTNFKQVLLKPPELNFFNGLGGFSTDGKEYITLLQEGQWTPAPWINVIANAHDFGFQISETGAGFTWSLNSRENRLTPWSNDPVCDPPGDIIYLRDEETGEIWTPTPLPIRDADSYLIRHGQGYTTFEHVTRGFAHTLNLFVPKEDPVKIAHLRIKNISSKKRTVSITGYVEWVLGNQREKSAPYVFTEVDSESQALFAKNPYNHEFAERIAFFDISAKERTFTCDRKEFLGRNGSYESPEALTREGLASHRGMGFDPCGVLQTLVTIRSQQEYEVVFILGQTESREKARELVQKYKNMDQVQAAYHEVRVMWDEILETIQVRTPEVSLNFMMNRWLLYQALVCRMWARSAFYQSGGAYGFRDQLQDSMAFVYATPKISREHILRAASRQFPEGDVQHWWHPPTGRGVRTHFSDDLLWLPFVVSHYVRVTGDATLLQEPVFFIEAPLLQPEQEDSYTQPQKSEEKNSLLDHCLRAIEHSLPVGVHDLPLIGSGDWNDGMNRIGEKGQGESVWMGWFLYKVLKDFLPFCDAERGQRYRAHMEKLKTALEAHAWDGDWYRRAFFDDGTPLGSAGSEECQIDSLAQTWSVLSGAGDSERQKKAMQKVSERLILWDKDLVLLLTPPFDHTALDPGYIKGYVPGVRENGGQYTHAALWVLMAYAELNDREKVMGLFNMLNPINHSRNRVGLQKYKIEPYVVAADVYAVEPHTGRGGWSWYTGSASWFYRAGLESLLGFHVVGDRLHLKPCVPTHWRSYELTYRYKTSVYEIRVENKAKLAAGQILVLEDGKITSENGVLHLVNDGKTHKVVVHNPS